ncbi:MAG: ferrous iron transport protein B [Anaerolineae bacterium]|nr:ferrous iron transport protein B [Anaerolineae bacterium]
MPHCQTIALAGNPNVGKSTLFNALTGERQHVGNWPGKTVEKMAGIAHIGARDFTVIDLPGTYSLNAYSSEEIIARDFIINERPSAIVAVADSANLERNLYLALQVLELGVPVVLALNMADAAQRRGITIDTAALSARLNGLPVVETVGSRAVGLDALREAIAIQTGPTPRLLPTPVDYGQPLESEIAALQAQIEADPILSHQFRPRWLAIKLLENDEDLHARLSGAGYHALIEATGAAMARIAAQTGEDAETLITDRRYQVIAGLLRGVVRRPDGQIETRSDRADRIITHPLWGVLIFLLLMWIVFQFTAYVSAPFLDWIDAIISGPLTRWALAALDAAHLGGTWLAALVVDGVIAGVGGVLVFVPVLLFLYLALAVLEDSGYMARSAFVMDRFMHSIGLHGKSFLPLIVGFGCTVPAIYATRTLEDEDDRKLTAFITPFMSCGARLPVYIVFGAAFFGAKSGNLIFGLYLLGIAIALLTGFAMKRTVYRHKPPQPFVLELPPYHMPIVGNVWRQAWQRTAQFLRNAATIILVATIFIWFLLALPVRGEGKFNDVPTGDSLFGSASRALAPVLAPAGFGSWEAAGSLITGFVAKEAVVSTMSQIYVEEAEEDAGDEDDADAPDFVEDLREIARSFGEAAILTVQETANIVPRTVNLLPGVNIGLGDWLDRGEDAEELTSLQGALTTSFARTAGSAERGKLAAVAFSVFVLLYVPCMATVAAIRHEFGGRWVLYQVAYTLFVAWLAATLVYQGGLLLGIG